MDEKEAKGRAKEAVGDATGDKDMQREGKVDQGAGKADEAIDKAAETAKEQLRKH